MVHPPYKQQQGDIRGDCRSGYGMFVSSLYLMFFWSNIRSGQARWVREGQCVVHSFFANFCLLWTFLVWRVTTSKEFYNLLPCQAAATFCWWAEVLPQVHHNGRERRVVNFGTWRWRCCRWRWCCCRWRWFCCCWRWFCCCCRRWGGALLHTCWWRCWGDRTTWDLGWRGTPLLHLFSSFWWNLFCALTRRLIKDFLSPSGDLGIGLVWDNNLTTGPHRSFLVWLLKSSSNWTKLSMRGPQLFSGWYQMIFRLGSD